MTRDEIAAKALQGLCANPGGPFQASDGCGWTLVNCTLEQVAETAYDLADAMMRVAARTTPAAAAEPSEAQDAARYRWLRERNSILDDEDGIFTAYRITALDGTFDHNELLAFEQMDAVIDAALKESASRAKP
jgi:hypothetical protein